MFGLNETQKQTMTPSNVGWILEEDLVDFNTQRIAEELELRGNPYQTVRYTMGGFGAFKSNFDYFNSPIIYRGSIQGSRTFERTIKVGLFDGRMVIPGVYCSWNNYPCSYYYPKLKHHLLNKPNIMVPFGALFEPEQVEFLFEALGEDRTLFVRPDSGFKTFTGKTIEKEMWEKDVANLGYGDIDHNAMVLVSRPVNLSYEERLVIHNKHVVTGSRYRQFGKHDEHPELQPHTIEYAESVLKDIDWQPDDIWIMDIAHTKGGSIKVLEIGAFSIAGLYNCDISKVVDAANSAALAYYLEENLS